MITQGRACSREPDPGHLSAKPWRLDRSRHASTLKLTIVFGLSVRRSGTVVDFYQRGSAGFRRGSRRDYRHEAAYQSWSVAGFKKAGRPYG
jgi:hypothetical protein